MHFFGRKFKGFTRLKIKLKIEKGPKRIQENIAYFITIEKERIELK